MKLRCTRLLPVFFLLLPLTGCDLEGNTNAGPDTVVFLNVELEDNSLYDHGIFQLYLNQSLVSSDFTCTMTHPFNPGLACNGSYDAGSNLMQITMDSDGKRLSLNYENLNNILVDLDLNDGNPHLIGHARRAVTRFSSRGHMYPSGAKEMIFKVDNVSPKHTTANIKFTSSVAQDQSPKASFTATVWSTSGTSYSSSYENYRVVALNNGFPQGNIGYVEYPFVWSDIEQGTFTWYLCTLNGATTACDTEGGDVSDLQTYTVTWSSLPDPEETAESSTQTRLFANGARPTALADIRVKDSEAIPNDVSADMISAQDTLTLLGTGPYTLTWANTTQNPTTWDWQVVFKDVTATQPDAGIATPRKIAGETDGPVYDSDLEQFTWTLHEDMAVALGQTMEVKILVFNSTRTMSAETPPFYIKR